MGGLEPLAPHIVAEAVARALREDLGDAGDITTDGVVAFDASAGARLVARAPGVVAGLDLAERAFLSLDPQARFVREHADGDVIDGGDTLAHIDGRARALLSGERVALNFVGHLSGIATLTAAFVAAAKGYKARITCTRKTTPGLRALEKYAVRAGGGFNHRFGLYDGILIKDNHIAAAGGVAQALEAARARAGHMVKVEIEIDRLEQLDDALKHGAECVLLDNMTPAQLRNAVAKANGRVAIEASGGVTLDTVASIAAAGVDLISIGRLTHSAPSLDVALEFDGS